MSITKQVFITPKLIYKATIINNGDGKRRLYFGASDITFKETYHNHTQDFNLECYSN